ncbi:unnamed protein product [Discosporangium mesarthrocarpum]
MNIKERGLFLREGGHQRERFSFLLGRVTATSASMTDQSMDYSMTGDEAELSPAYRCDGQGRGGGSDLQASHSLVGEDINHTQPNTPGTAPPTPTTTKPQFLASPRVGARIQSNLGGKGKYRPGHITRVNRDGSCDLLFDNGEREVSVEIDRIKEAADDFVPSRNSDQCPNGRRKDSGNGGGVTDRIVRTSEGKASFIAKVSVDDGSALSGKSFPGGEWVGNEKCSNTTVAGGTDVSVEGSKLSGTKYGSIIDHRESVLPVGARVKVDHFRRGHLYNGTVTKVNDNDTFSIEYDDGSRWAPNSALSVRLGEFLIDLV